jgi:hypothetical protein
MKVLIGDLTVTKDLTDCPPEFNPKLLTREQFGLRGGMFGG